MSKLELEHVRFGFATNSSSTHSIVVMRNMPPDDYVIGEFGWENFTLATEKAKKEYLAATLAGSLKNFMPPQVANELACYRIGIPVVDDVGCVDHQSRWSLPRKLGTKELDWEFFEVLKNTVLRPDVAILGGNDDEVHPLLGSAESKINFKCVTDELPLVSRKDVNVWVLFDQRQGSKFRIKLSPNKMEELESSVPETPELMDVKLTNCCPYACPYCYQDSKSDGKCSDMNGDALASILADLRLFEVALGGGEPTLYPAFWELLRNVRTFDIVPSFATRNLDWLRNPKAVEIVNSNCGAVAYSFVHESSDIKKFASLCLAAGIVVDKNIHVVIGNGFINNSYCLELILKEAATFELNVTLLGAKYIGRAEKVIELEKSDQNNWWLKPIETALKEGRGPSISIDTLLAKTFAKELVDLDIPSWMYETEEGKYSCYLDLVEGKVGPSSYAPDKMVKLKTISSEAIAAEFKKMHYTADFSL